MSENNKILLALLGGAAMGAALGLLFAPTDGKETREKVADAAQDLGKKIMKKAEEMIS